jgi:NADPH:quinone reductase-like Zn-dependent oxidoreductase
MKAAIRTEYGTPDVVQIKEVEKPTPNDDQVLVKVYASSVNAADWHDLTADIFLVRLMGGGLLKPKDPSLGIDFAGKVEAVGKNVTDFKPGDEVFGGRGGAFAEYVVVKNAIVHKPANISFEQAASVPVAAVTALEGLRDKGKIQAGQKVLIHGASGGVGTFAVQIAKAYGTEVTAVCSTRNVEMVRSIGADHVIDYKKEDVTKLGQRFDLILAVNGYHSLFDYKRILAPNGIYVMAGGSQPVGQIIESVILGRLLSMTGGGSPFYIADLTRPNLLYLKELLEAGKIVPVIDHCYPLSETAQAMRHLGETHARGKIVISVAQTP